MYPKKCSFKALTDGAGIELTCGGKVVGTLQNGEDGAMAKNCEALDDGNGTVTIKCGDGSQITRYKALCGTEPYDPENKVCLSVDDNDGKIIGTLAPLCNGKPYNPYDIPDDVSLIDGPIEEFLVIDFLKASSKQACKDGIIVDAPVDEEK